MTWLVRSGQLALLLAILCLLALLALLPKRLRNLNVRMIVAWRRALSRNSRNARP